MVKHLNGWEMSKKLNANCKLFVKIFLTNNWCKNNMYERLRKTIGKEQYGHFILHVVTNDLSSDKSPGEIARSITDLAASIKNEKNYVSMSNIIFRAEDENLEEKRCEVNSFWGNCARRRTVNLLTIPRESKETI